MRRSSLFGARAIAAALAATTLAAAAGCTRTEPPRFRLNTEGFDPASLKTKEDRQAQRERDQKIVNQLTAAFGTPDEPYVFPETGLDLKKLQLAAGPTYSDQAGYQRGLYRRHCAHCHGITGDGAGPTALFLDPYPRDYRQGKFKFTSTNADTSKPTTADLKRILKEGVPGTAMPSFKLLSEHEIDALVEYVKYLSIRGETEINLNIMVDSDEELPSDRTALVEKVLEAVDGPLGWKIAEESVLVPDQEHLPPLDATQDAAGYAASVERGRLLFRNGATFNCVKCHGLTSLGDAGGEPIFDDWNKDKDPLNKPDLYWSLKKKQRLDPRNLRLGIYRGGRRPVDLYRRIAAGIKGTPMPAFGKTLNFPAQYWDLVNYVLSLPYEEDRAAQPAEEQHAGIDRPTF